MKILLALTTLILLISYTQAQQPEVKDLEQENKLEGGFESQYNNNKCIRECIDDKIEAQDNKVHMPESQADLDKQTEPYIKCFDKKCPNGERQKFDDPEIIQSKGEGEKVAECANSCFDELESKYYKIQEVCKFKCLIDKSNTASENISGFMFLGLVGAIVAFLLYKKKNQ